MIQKLNTVIFLHRKIENFLCLFGYFLIFWHYPLTSQVLEHLGGVQGPLLVQIISLWQPQVILEISISAYFCADIHSRKFALYSSYNS